LLYSQSLTERVDEAREKMCPPPKSTSGKKAKVPATAAAGSSHAVDQQTNKSFRYVDNKEPHASRRREILEKYPEIEELYGPDLRLVPWCLALVAIQVVLAAHASRMSWTVFWVTAYAVGGTFSHSLSLAGHELSHNLCFRRPLYNELLAVFCNLGQGIASAITFKRYHLEHHMYQGVEGIDTDLPSEWEVRTFDRGAFAKLIWLFLQPWMYAFRPLLTNPKTLTRMELVNIACVYSWDAFLVYRYGLAAAGYFLASIWFGMSFHPVAGHFISEHYLMNPDSSQETYSYYGPLNLMYFNVGYHNEHHDFPRVAGFSLPKVRQIAPEYYDERWVTDDTPNGLAHHTSWTKVLVDYVLDPRIGPHSRVKRAARRGKKVGDNKSRHTKKAE